MSITPQVGIIMGSDSDLSIMSEAAKVLEDFGIPFEIDVISAHRTPEQMLEYAKNAESKGIKVIIAGAGGAAHLPGMTAALTVIPVIGVPIKTKSLEGIDSLLSVVQMPPGVPVATVAINGAKNAGILAAQIIGTGNTELLQKISRYKEELKESVKVKSNQLNVQGYKTYLANLEDSKKM